MNCIPLILQLKDRLLWHKVLLPVHKKFESVIGKELIYAIYNVAAQVENEKAAKK